MQWLVGSETEISSSLTINAVLLDNYTSGTILSTCSITGMSVSGPHTDRVTSYMHKYVQCIAVSLMVSAHELAH